MVKFGRSWYELDNSRPSNDLKYANAMDSNVILPLWFV